MLGSTLADELNPPITQKNKEPPDMLCHRTTKYESYLSGGISPLHGSLERMVSLKIACFATPILTRKL